jgi:hypothetical protein
MTMPKGLSPRIARFETITTAAQEGAGQRHRPARRAGDGGVALLGLRRHIHLDGRRRRQRAVDWVLGDAPPRTNGALRNKEMSELQDLTMVCRDCGEAFVFTRGEQCYFTAHQLAPPKRCQPCRAHAKAQRELGDAGTRRQRDTVYSAGFAPKAARE